MKNEVEIVRLEGGMETLRIELRANGLLLDSDNIAEKLEQSLGALRENDELDHPSMKKLLLAVAQLGLHTS